METEISQISRTCNVCKLDKELSTNYFYFYKERKKFKITCIECCKKRVKINYNKNPEKHKEACKKYVEKNKEKLKEYNRQYAKKYYYKYQEKFKDLAKIYATKNKEKRKKYQKEWIEKNKEHIRQYDRDRYAKEDVKKSANKRNKKKYHNNPLVKLRRNISADIRDNLKKINLSKNYKSIIKYLPYSIKQLKEHLESLFDFWMTWSNWGRYNYKNWDDNNQLTWKWNIDHIIPQSDLSYTSMEDENFKKCWSLENLRPYSAKQNVIDGASKIRHKKEEK